MEDLLKLTPEELKVAIHQAPYENPSFHLVREMAHLVNYYDLVQNRRSLKRSELKRLAIAQTIVMNDILK